MKHDAPCTTKTFYKNGKQVGWPELFQNGVFQGMIIEGKPHYGHIENGDFVEQIAPDCICKIATPEKIVAPKIQSRYDKTGKWEGYRLDPAQVFVKISGYNSEADACAAKKTIDLSVIDQYHYSVRQGSLHREIRTYGYANRYGHVIRISEQPQRERD